MLRRYEVMSITSIAYGLFQSFLLLLLLVEHTQVEGAPMPSGDCTDPKAYLAALSPHLGRDIAPYATHACAYVRARVASNRNTPPDILLGMVNDKEDDPAVFLSILLNQAAPDYIKDAVEHRIMSETDQNKRRILDWAVAVRHGKAVVESPVQTAK